MRQGFRGRGALLALLAALPAFADLEPTTNVRLRSPQRRAWIRNSLESAARRLASPPCSRILSEFKDRQGRLLQSNLDALGLEAPDYMLRYVIFYDGDVDTTPACRLSAILATTEPGSRVVYVCPNLDRWHGPDRRWTEAILIHEVLHTLGLGENPPTSLEITHRVLLHCG